MCQGIVHCKTSTNHPVASPLHFQHSASKLARSVSHESVFAKDDVAMVLTEKMNLRSVLSVGDVTDVPIDRLKVSLPNSQFRKHAMPRSRCNVVTQHSYDRNQLAIAHLISANTSESSNVRVGTDHSKRTRD